MSHTPLPDPQRWEELLIDRATVGLNDEEWKELGGLRSSGHVEDDSFELAAAAADLALHRQRGSSQEPVMDTLPEKLRQRLLAEAEAVLPMVMTDSVATAETAMEEPASLALPTSYGAPRSRPSRQAWWGWLAAAASLLLAGFLWFARPGDEGQLTLAELRQHAPDLVQVDWQVLDDPTVKDASGKSVASGEVLWSDALQQGYMRFRKMQVNDPQIAQYQLWIFDKDRDERYPVDGGVFDIDDASGDVIVPIRAKLEVNQASMFAITVEAPGGVVVSDRKRLPLLAQVATE